MSNMYVTCREVRQDGPQHKLVPLTGQVLALETGPPQSQQVGPGVRGNPEEMRHCMSASGKHGGGEKRAPESQVEIPELQEQ